MTSLLITKPTHSTFIDLEGKQFDRLTVIGFVGRKWRNAVWLCECNCGNVTQVKSSALINRTTKSCGCLKDENTSKRSRTHGHAGALTGLQSAAYNAWCNMKTRCTNENRKEFARYGGRGIQICDRWMNSFENFIEDMGEPPANHSLDRIKNDEGYSPTNCKWSTMKQQANNTRRNRIVVIDGQSMTAKQAAERYAVSEFTIYGRLNRGLRDHEAVFGRAK